MTIIATCGVCCTSVCTCLTGCSSFRSLYCYMALRHACNICATVLNGDIATRLHLLASEYRKTSSQSDHWCCGAYTIVR